jgi:hypothetical protein
MNKCKIAAKGRDGWAERRVLEHRSTKAAVLGE